MKTEYHCMVEREEIHNAGWRDNEPNRATTIFEFECKTEVLISDLDLQANASSFIWNFGECPEPLIRKFIGNALRVRKALKEGIKPGDFDTKTHCDVWNVAIGRGVPVTLPPVFEGDLYVYGSAKLDAPPPAEIRQWEKMEGLSLASNLTTQIYGNRDLQKYIRPG